MPDTGEISIALTPIQLYAVLNGKTISQSEIASNTWHEMPAAPRGGADFSALQRYLHAPVLSPGFPVAPPDPRQRAWEHQGHYSQPNAPGCWIPPHVHQDPKALPRAFGAMQLFFGATEVVGGVVLLITPEPTMLTKVGGTVALAHGIDTTQAAIRQLFSGKPVNTVTADAATLAARSAGASPHTAAMIGVVMDVAVPVASGVGAGYGAERAIAIRSGRIILSEEAIEGRLGRVSLDVEEADEAIGKEGGHTKLEHVDRDIKQRALESKRKKITTSRFFSKLDAEDAINDAIRAHRNEMREWAAKAAPDARQGFVFETGKPIGLAYFKATDSYEEFSKVNVVLRMSVSPGKRLYIFTAYPVR